MENKQWMDEWVIGIVSLGSLSILALVLTGVGLLIGCPGIVKVAGLVAGIVGPCTVLLAITFVTGRLTSPK